MYLAALADAGAAVATIEKTLAAIAHEHRSRGPAVRETMAGIRRKLGTSPGVMATNRRAAGRPAASAPPSTARPGGMDE